ncbi:glycosyltransferase [Thiohalomonas denitrificans]|uniref:glycosyltransferase n=1 Tax=Thiohalomonas denitrificans TaxID=415747 RepID=UPI0026EB922A|nr:glycosyltransferase [Thiohalomonas denitrificans]
MEKTTRVLNITHLASGDLWAGAEVQIFNLVKAQMCLEGVQVSVILLNEGVLSRKLRQIGIEVHVISEEEKGCFALFFKVYSLVKAKSPPHIVHTHRRKENLLGALAAYSLFRVYSIRTVHGAPEPVERTVAFTQWLLRTVDGLVARFLQSTTVAVSQELGANLSKLYGRRHVCVVPNGIDVADLLATVNLQSGHCAYRKDRTRIAFVGRLVPIKRPDRFLDVAKKLSARRPGRYEFYIFGDGPLRSETENYLKSHHLVETVHCMGFREDIATCLAEMDMLLMVSDHEGLPMTLLECLALGVPVIARGVGGIPQVLGNGDAGRIVEDDGSDSVLQAVLELERDPSGKQRMVDEGRRRVMQHFSASACAEQYQEIYQGVIRTAGQQSGSGKQVNGTEYGS